MYAEDLACNNRSYWNGVEGVDERLPHLDRTPSFAFVVEAIDTSDVGAFVITTQQEEVFWESELIAQQKQDRFKRLLSSVHIISQKQEVAVRWEAAHFEHAYQISILPVYVSYDFDGRRKFQ